MSDTAELIALFTGSGVAGAGALKLVEWLVSSKFQRANALEATAEAKRETKLEELIFAVGELKNEVSLLRERIATNAGAMSEVAQRLDGMSSNHGSRIQQTEAGLIELRTLARPSGVYRDPTRSRRKK